MRRFEKLVVVSVAVIGSAMAACSGADPSAESGGEDGSALAFHAETAPLAGFAHDTGLVPLGSPAQVQLAFSGAGALRVDAEADRAEARIVGKPGGGKLTIDLHVKASGRLKVDSPFKSYDGELPGLKNIDIPIVGTKPFDGLLLGPNQSAVAQAAVPETTLPEIPLGGVPGTLVLTVAKGSTLTTRVRGTCLAVASGKATYGTESKTSGTLVLRGKIVMKLPPPLDKSIDLPEMKIPIPEVTSAAASTVSVPGAPDAKEGECRAGDGGDASDGGASSSGGSSSSGSSSSSGGSSSGGVAPSTFSVKINGSVTGVPATIVPFVDPIFLGKVRKGAILYFTAPGLVGPTHVTVYATTAGTGCSSVLGFLEQQVEYQSESSFGRRNYVATPATGPCGLTVANASNRLTGTFNGTLTGQNGTTGTTTMSLAFDVAMPP